MDRLRRLSRYVMLLCLLAIVGCRKGDSADKRDEIAPRTLFVYMAADNSLGQQGFDEQNIAGMVAGATKANIGDGRIIVYHDSYRSDPVLLEIRAGKNGQGTEQVLKEYTDQNAADPQVLASVIADMQHYAPAQKYGLVFWSHATNWLPASEMKSGNSIWENYAVRRSSQFQQSFSNTTYQNLRTIVLQDSNLQTKAFPQDGSNWGDVQAFAQALPSGVFDYVIFDACLMGSVEVLYDMKDKTDYLIASPAEVMGVGMPYERVMPYLFAPEPQLAELCKAFCDFYTTYSDPYATIALYDCGQVEELTQVMREIVARYRDRIPDMDVSALQYYYASYRRSMFDLGDFVRALLGESEPALLSRFEQAMAKVVVPEGRFSTERGVGFAIRSYSGLSTYIPRSVYSDLNPFYEQISWYKAVWQ